MRQGRKGSEKERSRALELARRATPPWQRIILGYPTPSFSFSLYLAALFFFFLSLPSLAFSFTFVSAIFISSDLEFELQLTEVNSAQLSFLFISKYIIFMKLTGTVTKLRMQ